MDSEEEFPFEEDAVFDEISEEEIEEIHRKKIMKQRLEDLFGPAISLIINITILLLLFIFIVTKVTEQAKEQVVETKPDKPPRLTPEKPTEEKKKDKSIKEQDSDISESDTNQHEEVVQDSESDPLEADFNNPFDDGAPVESGSQLGHLGSLGAFILFLDK